MSPSAGEDEGKQASGSSSSPLERLVELGVYAPLGLLANKDQVVSDLIEQGRKQAAFSRSLGRAALKAISSASPQKRASAAASAVPTRSKKAAPAAQTGAIDDYESLTAREIIAGVPSYTPEQRAWIAKTERAGKGRVTVLRAVQGD